MSRCFCGGPWDYSHHYTGRDHEGRYLDPEFKGPACHDDHYLLHDDWHTQEIEKVLSPLTFFERVEIRLRRWAANCARMDEAMRGGTPHGLLGMILARWADELRRGIDVLDYRYPGWREDAGFYPEGG